MAERLALLIANSTYRDERIPDLASPTGDVTELAEILASHEIGRYQVTTVVDQSWHHIHEHVGDFFSGRSPDDMLLLFISGHGIRDEDELYFPAHDSQIDRLTYTSLSASHLSRTIERSRSTRVLVVVDSCFSGALRLPLGIKSVPAGLPPNLLDLTEKAGKGRAILSSSSAIEYSLERTESERPVSIFTNCILQGLRTGSADVDGDGVVGVKDLHEYVSRAFTEQAETQTPLLHTVGLRADMPVAWTPASYTQSRGLSTPRPFGEIVEDAISQIEALNHAGFRQGASGGHLSAGLDSLDELIDGVAPGEVLVICGESSVGKTTYGLNLARHNAIYRNRRTLFITLESTATDLMNRLLAAEAKIPLSNIRRGMMREQDWTRLARTMGETSEAPLSIWSTPIGSADALTERLLNLDEELDLVIVDPIDLIGDPDDPNDRARIIRSLKRYALERHVAVAVTVSTPRDSSTVTPPNGLDRFADILIGIYRADQHDAESPRAGEADFLVFKCRRGIASSWSYDHVALCAFQGHYARFVDLALDVPTPADPRS